MVRFSCFNAHSHSHKPKRTSQMPFESMQKTLEDYPQDQLSKGFINPACIESQHMKDHSGDLLNNRSMLVAGSSSVERGWKSEEINGKFTVESNLTGHLKKSRSLGSVLEQEGRVSGSNDTEDEIDHGYSCDDAPCQNGLVVSAVSKDPETSILNQGQEAFPSESPQVSSDMVNNESIFSVGDPQNIEKEGHEYSDTQLSGECTGNSGETTPRALPVIVKACSMPNIASGAQIPPTILGPRSRSSEDLQVLERKEKDNLVHQVVCKVIQDQVKDDVKVEKNNLETIVEDGFESYNYAGTAKDWIIPVADEEHQVNYLKGESSGHQSAGSPGREYKIKRIEEWVINLQHCSSLDENNEPSHDTDQVKRVSDIDGLAASKLESKATPGMEAAKKYISSLPVTANTAQLSNLGLVVIPFLSAFVSLKVLNLSGNAIVRITAGALPRGLHMLNLAKNNISTIEGLRELNRLRVLDLSYNRIVRIGHGLASCSSLKELYLAGNKISEVEGLHRLLKLNVLDLRFNKISTAKCLGQLAANYISMQAISLEGNPAQKNVGDEQLRKQLQGLLPQLAYYNRQPIKAGTLKDTADRSTRLGTSHQFDRGLRSDHRSSRKGAYGVAAHKASSSSTHGRKSQAIISPKRTRGSRHGHLPPSGTRGTAQHQYQHFDFSSKTLSVRPDLSMRRSRSEGTLGAL